MGKKKAGKKQQNQAEDDDWDAILEAEAQTAPAADAAKEEPKAEEPKKEEPAAAAPKAVDAAAAFLAAQGLDVGGDDDAAKNKNKKKKKKKGPGGGEKKEEEKVRHCQAFVALRPKIWSAKGKYCFFFYLANTDFTLIGFCSWKNGPRTSPSATRRGGTY